MNKIFHFLKLQEFINELGKIRFHWEKWNLGHITGFLIFGKALLILLIMQISTQTDNHKDIKSVATKKVLFKKNGSEVSKP